MKSMKMSLIHLDAFMIPPSFYIFKHQNSRIFPIFFVIIFSESLVIYFFIFQDLIYILSVNVFDQYAVKMLFFRLSRFNLHQYPKIKGNHRCLKFLTLQQILIFNPLH